MQNAGILRIIQETFIVQNIPSGREGGELVNYVQTNV